MSPTHFLRKWVASFTIAPPSLGELKDTVAYKKTTERPLMEFLSYAIEVECRPWSSIINPPLPEHKRRVHVGWGQSHHVSDFFGDHPQLLKVHKAVHAGVIAWERRNERRKVKQQSHKFLLTTSVVCDVTVDLSAENLLVLLGIYWGFLTGRKANQQLTL